MSDTNPLATGPMKGRAERCTTHHYACDCRELETAEIIDKLEAEKDRLRAALDKIAESTGSDDRWRCLVQIARDALRSNP